MKFLVIGTGLAGICLSEQILKSGHDLKVIGKVDQPSSTEVATGMYNPIVFRHLHKSWLIDQLLPIMHQFYGELEKKLSLSLNEQIQLWKKIPNQDYEKWWLKRTSDPEYTNYLGKLEGLYGLVLNAGLVNTASLKSAYERMLASKSLLKDQLFEVNDLTTTSNGYKYEEEAFDKVVYCEGPYAATNPLFEWLPWNICKGEWIEIETEEEICTDVINAVINIIPIGNNRYKLSSTFSWEDYDWNTTINGREFLINQFEKLYRISFKVVDQQAALRPTVADRRPYLGEHPGNKNIFIFNGLGSKGVMLAPYFSKHLLDHIIEGCPLNEEVSIQRHIKRYNHHIGLYR